MSEHLWKFHDIRSLFGTISFFQYQIINWSNRPWRQFTINYSAVCCSLKQTKTPTTHTRSKTKTDEALSESTQKQRPTVSANPRLPLEDRRVRQAKLSSVQNTQIKSTFVELKIKLMALRHHADPASDKLSARRAKLRAYFQKIKQTLPAFWGKKNHQSENITKNEFRSA